MALRKQKVLRWFPGGLCDGYDSTFTFEGSCTALSNLIFDQANPEAVVSRPGVGTAFTTFSGFTAPGFVSLHVAVGNMLYGWIASGRTTGFDEPFAYNTVTGLFITLTGVTAANVPTSPPSTGAWTPPTATVVGTYLILTHPGFSGTGTNFFGVINLSTNAYSSSNTATSPLPGVPTAVANFNNRAYFVVGAVVYYSDSLNPLSRTSTGQSVTVGDVSGISALSGLPVTTSTAGVIPALIVFKTGQVWQLTGDPALTSNPLSLTYLSLSQGTSAPRSVCQTTRGTFFIGTDGPMIIDALGNVRALTFYESQTSDVRVPFLNVTIPSRVEGEYAANIYRVCVPTTLNGNQVTNDYWFDVNRGRWTGPHTFAYDCASSLGSTFVLSSVNAPGKLFYSTPNPTTTSVYNDNGTALMVAIQSSAFPMAGDMQEYAVMETVVELASGGAQVQYTVAFSDTYNNTLATANITTAQQGLVWGGGTVWGGAGATWASSLKIPNDFTAPWAAPVVSDKFIFRASALSSSALLLGVLQCRAQPIGYTLRS